MKVLFYPSILDLMYGFVAAEWRRRDSSFTASAVASGRQSAVNLRTRYDKWAHLRLLWEDIEDADLHRPPDREFLRRFEAEFAPPNLSLAASADRFLSTEPTPRRERLIEVTIRVLEQAWRAVDPDAVVAEGISDLPSYLLWAMCRARSKPFVFLVSRGIDGRSGIVNNDQDRWPLVDELLGEMLRRGLNDRQRSAALSYIRRFRERPAAPAYIQLLGRPSVRPSDVRRLVSIASAHRRDAHDPNYVGPLRAVTNRLQRVVRAGAAGARMFERPRSGEQYVLFPLQLQPEMTTSVLAPFHVDQLATAEYVAKSLPAGYVLWIKEHRYSVGRRPLSYYERLRRVSNARLLSPWEDPFELMRGASAVVTISSTLGWEALLLGIPVVTLGHVFINSCRLVRHVTRFEDLYVALAAAVDQPHAREPDERLVAFVAAMLEGTYPGEAGGAPADFPRSLDPANVALVTESLRREIVRLRSGNDAPTPAGVGDEPGVG